MASKCICPGDLKRRILIEQVGRARDAVGGQVEAWGELATVWAKVEPLSATERYWRQQTAGQASHRVTIRYRTDVTTKMRVSYNGRRFEIRGVTDVDDARAWLELSCDELAAV